MTKQNNLKTIWDVLTRPEVYFQKLSADLPELRPFIMSYGAPLFLLAAAGRMTRLMLAYEANEIMLGGDQLAGLFLISLSAYALSVWLGAKIITRMAKAFHSEQNLDKSMLLIILAHTPFMLSQPLSLFAGFIPIFGIIYTVLLFGMGAPYVLNTPKQKVIGFTLISYFVIFSISHLVTYLMSELFIFAT